jgi:hypothetical protein
VSIAAVANERRLTANFTNRRRPYIYKNFGMQMLQQPHEIMIFYDEGPDIRHVRMNEPHRARAKHGMATRSAITKATRW